MPYNVLTLKEICIFIPLIKDREMRKGIIASLLVIIMFGFFVKSASANIFHENLNNVISLVDKVLNEGVTILADGDEADSSTITHFGNMQYDSAKGELKLGRAMIFFICALILGLIIGGAYFIKSSRQKHIDKEQGMLKALLITFLILFILKILKVNLHV
jgi:cytosine/uracil/thiamine/allantoin permease